jgi:NADPH:quinone reductase-like Zn-dependent oxidoreductase
VPVPHSRGADQVLIRVAGSSLNPLEYKLADLNFFGRAPPVVLGLDLSGIVVAIGSAVRGIAVGDSVVAMADLNGDGGWVAGGGGEGGYALAREFLTVPKARIPELPPWGSSADVLPFSLRGSQRHCPSR